MEQCGLCHLVFSEASVVNLALSPCIAPILAHRIESRFCMLHARLGVAPSITLFSMLGAQGISLTDSSSGFPSVTNR
jgi:hypothetical protein